jgi:malate dehydrogenase (quinone)
MSGTYDLVVVGGGISGASLCYVTARFTDVERIALLEKESTVGGMNSRHRNNSQTLHFVDIETNYPFEKAASVKTGAEMLAGYLERVDPDREFHDRRSKMVLGVGADEVATLRARLEAEGFGDLFPKLRAVGREEIRDLEPAVVEGRDPDTELLALHTPDGYVVDYGAAARSFVEAASEEPGVDVYTNTPVTGVTDEGDGFTVEASDASFETEALVVAAGCQTLGIAKQMGYAADRSLLPVAGSFFLADDLLNGKVYTVQTDALPFAAVHGDADVYDPSVTRFGPTAKPVPTLERGRLSTVRDALDGVELGPSSVASHLRVLADPVLLPFVLENLVYDLPVVGPRAFLPHVRKVVPDVDLSDVERAAGYGGVRPQLVDTAAGRLEMGEATIRGDGVLFNVTPSPGASTSLQNARRDAETVLSFVDDAGEFDEDGFRAATIDNFPRG